MAKRRANNEGTIYQKPNGKWRAQISIEGHRLSHTGSTQRECQIWIKETRNQIDRGLTFKGADTKLGIFLDDWLGTISSSRSQGTYTLYRWTVEKRIKPFLGKKKIKDLRPDLIQFFYDRMRKIGHSKHAVHCMHKVLRVALNHAVKLGVIGRNPCTGTIPPKPKQSEMKFYDENQVIKLLKTAKDIQDNLYPLYYLAIHTGMRQGELMGLMWNDLDWERKTLDVRRQVRHFKGGGYTFSKPKSKSGNRRITIGEQTLSVLQEHKTQQMKEIQVTGEEWENLNLIFPSGVGTPLTASNIRRAFRKLIKASGLHKIRFHDLRHTAVSLMLNHGIPVLVVSKRLGHSKPSITMDVYGHLIPSKQEEAANLMDSIMSPE